MASSHILREMGGREGLHKFLLEHNFRCPPDAARSKSAFYPASGFQMGVAITSEELPWIEREQHS